MKSVVKKTVASCLLLALPTAAFAYDKIDPAEAAKLGTELTPIGADPSANADGSIPAWSGSIVGVPEGLKYTGSGTPYPDPYAAEKPLFSINKGNLDQHKSKLTAGTIALFEKYPDSFRLDVYPTHRDFKYNQKSLDRTKWNVGKTELVNGIDGLQNFTGAVPFPIPSLGAEIMWNSRVSQPTPIAESTYDMVAVYNDGKRQRHREKMIYEAPMAYNDNAVGATSADFGGMAAYVFLERLEPARKKGEMVVLHEPIDLVQDDRKAWLYIPGAQRVKRAPNAGYDTPIGPGGLVTVDDNLGFNGAMDRYDWKLVGKKEMYLPFHAYKFDDPNATYANIMTAKHVNPDFMRYELQRVWVVEATLKEGQRHLYAKRRFYINEDSWLIVSSDAFDGRGELWRVGYQNTVYDYFLKGYIVRAQFNYDLQASAYVGVRLINETSPTDYSIKPYGQSFYSPNSLRKRGRR